MAGVVDAMPQGGEEELVGTVDGKDWGRERRQLFCTFLTRPVPGGAKAWSDGFGARLDRAARY